MQRELNLQSLFDEILEAKEKEDDQLATVLMSLIVLQITPLAMSLEPTLDHSSEFEMIMGEHFGDAPADPEQEAGCRAFLLGFVDARKGPKRDDGAWYLRGYELGSKTS